MGGTRRLTRRGLLLGAGALAVWSLVLFCAGAVWQPVWVQKLWIHVWPSSRWERYNALGRLVIPGMTPAEVKDILGSPAREDVMAGKVTWMYHDGSGTAGHDLDVVFEAKAWGPAGQRELRVREVVQDHEFVLFGPISTDYGWKYYRISVTQPTPPPRGPDALR